MAKNSKAKAVGKAALFVLAGAAIVGVAVGITKLSKDGFRLGLVDQLTSKEKIYSVEFKNGEVEGTRQDSAVGLTAGINGNINNFDNIYPWKDMKVVTDSNGDQFVKIPKFYEKIEFTDEGVKYSVTGEAKKGFHVDPAFIKGEEEVDEIQIGRFEASLSETGELESKSGKVVAGNKTLDEFRTIAEEGGNSLFDYRQNQALQTLFAVEFATTDSQSVMRGAVEYACVYAAEQDDGDERKFSVTTDEICAFEETKLDEIAYIGQNVFVTYCGDETVVLGNRKIEAIKFNTGKTAITSITLDEALDLEELSEDEDFDIENLCFDINGVQKTGATVGKRGSSVGDPEKAVAMSYRGIENWWGSSYTMIDGIYTVNESSTDKVAVSFDFTKNGDRTSYTKFTKANVTTKVTNGIYLNDQSATDAGDSFGVTSSSTAGEIRIGYVGGCYSDNVYAGAFNLGLFYDVDVADCNYGVRLSYIPQ